MTSSCLDDYIQKDPVSKVFKFSEFLGISERLYQDLPEDYKLYLILFILEVPCSTQYAQKGLGKRNAVNFGISFPNVFKN